MKMPSPSAYMPRREPRVAGSLPLDISANAMLGLWAFRVGRFGCRDSETRGGIIYFMEDSRMVGGDSHYSFTGRWHLRGSELRSTLNVRRLEPHADYAELPGFSGESFRLALSAEAIGEDYFEGRSHRAGYPEFRAIIRRVVEAV